MELGKHLGAGLWGAADKALPLAYGIGFVLLVIRVLPEQEYGNFVLAQEVFLIVSLLVAAFALQPMTKFLAEEGSTFRDVQGAGLFLSLAISAAASLIVFLGAEPLSRLLNAPGLGGLLRAVPLMLAASFPRNFTLAVLQARFQISRIFWVDAVHFIGAPLLVWAFSRFDMFHSADDLVTITIASLSLSSLLGIVLVRPHVHLTLQPAGRELRRMSLYGTYALGGNVSYLVYSRADTFILSAVTGPLQVAVYSSAKIFTRVYEMVTQIVQMIVLPATSRLASQGDLRSLRALVEKGILFLTVGMIPVTLIFLLMPEFLVRIVYNGKYADAAVLLRIFALLTGAIPLLAVGMNLLLGLGKARESFLLGIQMLGVSALCYLLFIPWLAEVGAAVAVVVSTYVLALFTARQIRTHTGSTVRGVLSRTADILAFVRTRVLERN